MFVSRDEAEEEKNRLNTFIDAIHAYHEIMRADESKEIPYLADDAIVFIDDNTNIVPLCMIDISSRATH